MEKVRIEEIQSALIIEVENVSVIHLPGPVARVKYVHGQTPHNGMDVWRTHVISDVAPRDDIGMLCAILGSDRYFSLKYGPT